MITKTGRKTWIITGATWIIALLFLVGVWLLSMTGALWAKAEDDLPARDYDKIEDWIEVTDSDVTDFIHLSNPGKAKPVGEVDTRPEFCYVFFSNATNSTFTLGGNFHITATNWYDYSPKLGSGTTLNGNMKVVWNSAIKGVRKDALGNVVLDEDGKPIKDPTSVDVVSGLLSSTASTSLIKDLYFYFTGSFYTKITSNHTSLTCGGMIGTNEGTIDHCRIESAGTIATEALKAESVSKVGGVIGENKGEIKNSAIISSSDVMVYTSGSGSTEYKYCSLYAGGVIGLASGKGLNSCSVLSKAKVLVCDYTRFFGNLGKLVSNFISSFLPGSSVTEEDYPFNPVRYVHPAGGVIGCADGNSYVKNCTIEAWGNATSIGYEGASNEGTIAGGFIGLLTEGYGGEISNNYFKLGCYIGSSFIQILEADVAEIVNELVNKRTVNIYGGAWIGKAGKEQGNYKYKSNVIYIEGDNSIIEAGINDENEHAESHSGLICGSTIRNATECTNNWLVRKLAQCDTGSLTNSGPTKAGFNFINVFGDGLVVATPSASGTITMKAAPGKSPFYGWTTEPNKENPEFNTSRTRQFSDVQNSVQYLFFIDTKIESSGELTQFALDVNLIKKYVWAHLSETENKDGKIHFSNMNITLKWLITSLEKDILVENGTPVIEDFYGQFNGKGHTISFASGSHISHDFKKDSDDKEKEYYEEYVTGLFGTVKSGAVVQDLNIVYGGSIKEDGGLTFGTTDSGKEQMGTLKETPKDGTNTVESRTCTYSSFNMPTSLDIDTAYLYCFTSVDASHPDYDASREWNPGYMQIYPCAPSVVIVTHYIGVLAGKNYGTISGVTMEMTTTGSITAQAQKVVCGGLIGYNNGVLTDADVTLKGKVTCTASESSKVGGMIGVNAGGSSVAFSKLNAWVTGEIVLKRAEKYHRTVKHFYEYAKSFSTKDECSDAGYEAIAYDFKDDEKFVFGVKNSQAIISDTIHGNDDTVTEQILGTLIGETSGSSMSYDGCVASAGDKGTFNSDIIQCEEENALIGGVIGKAANVPTFNNVWAVMSTRVVGRKAVSNRSIETGINTVYVDGGIAVGSIDDETDPVKFAIEAIEGKTFAGWYDHVTVSGNVLNTDDKEMIMTGFETEEVVMGDDETNTRIVEYFRPSNQAASNRIYYVRLINMQISQPSDLVALSETTRAGRSYEDITFSLAENFAIPESFKPIGTDEHPFLGIFDGNGLTLTFTGITDTSVVGLFGCVGKEGSTAGTVKNVVIEVTGILGKPATELLGVVAAKNYGTIGQDSSNGKIIVKVHRELNGVIVGGIVGENHGIVKNGEVTYYSTNENIGGITLNAGSKEAFAGGAVGKNANVSGVLVKNIIVLFDDTTGVSQISVIGSKNYAIGGLVGENGAGATVATSVAVMSHADVVYGMGSNGENKSRGYLIGKNLSQNVVSLWSVYKDPALGAPVSVYDGEESYPVVYSDLVLMNGVKCGEGNILIMYGAGAIDVAISGADDKISFYSTKTETEFYSYISDFDRGTYVTVEEGNTGYAFSPVQMAGKKYYAVFANSTIGDEADYNALADRINNDDFRAYVNYSLKAKIDLSGKNSVAIGADKDHPFRGSFNGNKYVITLYGNEEEGYAIHAVIGYVGEYSSILRLNVVAANGTKLEETGNNVPRGILSDVNYGTIDDVSVIVRGLALNEKGAVGALAGENNGTISSATVYLEYLEYLGIKSAGAFIGKVVGGAVGINKGTVGESGMKTVEVTVSTKDMEGILYGSMATGGVVGVNNNEGKILSATSKISGVLIGDNNVGGIVGSNQGVVRGVSSNILSGSTYFAGESFGGVAGENYGRIGDDETNDFLSDIRVYIAEAPNYERVSYSFTAPKADVPFLTKTIEAPTTKVIGGAAGVNYGSLLDLSIEIVRPLYASECVGGIAGLNLGSIAYSELATSKEATLVADHVGGIAAENRTDENGITFVKATLRGDLGSATAGADGIVQTSLVGGFFASSTRTNGATPNNEDITGGVAQVVVTLYGTLNGDTKALALARGNISVTNSWLQATNASPLPLDIGTNSGNKFNSIRVLNDILLDVMITTRPEPRIKFTSTVKSSTLKDVAEWYTDISGWRLGDNIKTGFLTENLIDENASYVTPRTPPAGVTYYVCYDTLEITSARELFELSIMINNHDYYRDVRFALAAGIFVEKGESLTPIGTEEHPFNAIFDGDENLVVFENGSIISGTEYAGLFGYTAKNSIIRNFILDIRTGAKLGGVNSKTIGALVGESHGRIEDVYVNLATDIVANSGATIGTFVGRFVSRAGNDTVNCWIASANSIYAPVGNKNDDATDLYYGINSLDILGSGALTIDYREIGSGIIYTVPSSVDVDLFAGFFSDIGESIRISDGESEYGTFKEPLGDSKEISIVPAKTVKNAVITVSFFKTVISNAKDFVNFAKNVNQYGDRGASFTLDITGSSVTIDFNECPSIGTKERPFTGTFEGNGKTICVTGNLIKRDYAGVFGYVGVGGEIKDLKIEVTGENVVFGDRSTLYAGVAAAYLRGTLNNVAVVVRADTVVHTTQGIAASGGIVGRAEEGYSLRNAWLVLAEGATVTNAVGEDTYYLANKGTNGIGRIMQQVGEGVLRTTVRKNISVEFLAESGSFYGYIDNDNNTEDKVTTIHDNGRADRWTIPHDDTAAGVNMLAIFIQADIKTYDDLKRLSSDVRMGRNYRGITYNLTADIVLGTDFIPIGGEFASDSSVSDSHILCTFIGGFNGNGHKITLPAAMNVGSSDALRYAGLFGRVGKEARIYDLLIVAPENTAIGLDTGDNTTRTLYAGALAGYYDMVSGGVSTKKGYFKNIFIILERGTTLYGATSVGRTFGHIPLEAGTVTENCWVISYNSKVNYEMNAAEMTYWNSLEKDVGTNQGGVHNVMVIAAGKVNVGRTEGNDAHFYLSVNDGASWYTLNSITDEQIFPSSVYSDNAYNPTGSEEFGFNVSYLKENITSLAELKNYADNINKGYDFYNLSFKLTTDIVIDRVENAKDFIAIGTAANGLNGTFDGCGHSITLSKSAKIEGEGIFGYIAEDGFLKNVRIVLQGTIESTGYAGAIGYNYGTMENVLVVADGATLISSVGYGFVIGHDDTNLLTNVWGLVDASEYLPEVGYSPANKPSVNTMKVVGIGKVTAEFNDASNEDYRVKFYEILGGESETKVGISGWYKSYEERQQISSAMLSGGELTELHLIAPVNSVAAHYEVAVIQTKIKNQTELIALASDVNIGGYTFKNVEFTLVSDINITTTLYRPIGDAEHPFKGILNGNGRTITVKTAISTGIFGNNEGEVKDLFVVIEGTVGEIQSDSNRIYGGIANLNGGSITHSKVTVETDAKIVGYALGGIAGRNNGTIEDCIVVVKGAIRATGGAGRNLYVGGVVGVNYGTVEGTSDFSKWDHKDTNVIITGTTEAIASGKGVTVNVGGIVGYNDSGKVVRMIAEVDGTVNAGALAEEPKDNVRAGGIVGHSRASIDHNVIILRGNVTGGLVGGTAGYLDGVSVHNTWQVTYTDTVDAAGKGVRQVNRLCVKGSGVIAVSIAFDTNSILFTDVTEDEGADIDGWYESGIAVDTKIGNVDEGTFRPNTNIQNKYVEVVFVNTSIKTAKDLVDMASSVSGGLSGTNIVFRLEFVGESLTIEESDVLRAIGTAKRPFNNVFDGGGKTLIFNTLGGQDYVGLFGYIGTQGIVRNVRLVLNAGTYGSAQAAYTALLAAYSDGTISNVTLVVNGDAILIGQSVGVVAGASFGEVSNVNVTMNGTISAVSDKDAYAAAVIAKNEERLTNVTVTSTGNISAVGQSYSYAGILAAKTTSTITAADVTTSSVLSAGAGNAYAGLGVGINLGKLEKVYICVTGGGFAGIGKNGGIVGNNANELSGVFIKLPEGGLGEGNDSAIGSIGGAGEAIRNVWVYAPDVASMSAVPAVNCIAAASAMSLSCPTPEEVLAGTIVYKGNITSLTDHFGLFAVVEEGTCEVGTGAVTAGVTHDTETEIDYLIFTSGAETTGVKAVFTARKAIGSGTELAAFAAAVNSGKYTFSGTFTLAKDIILPTGAFTAVGTEAHPLSGITFDGQDHVISVGDATIPSGIFGVTSATIENVGIRLTVSGDGTLVMKNNGTVRNVALYAEKGVAVNVGTVIVKEEHGTTSNAWVITRNEGTEHASYPVMKVNGSGNVTMKESALFAACVGDDTIFIGYADATSILVSEDTFATAGKTSSYTAEFISTVISNEDALRVLDGVMKLHYTGEGQLLTLGENVTVTSTLDGMNAYAFKGTIDGAGKTIAVNNAVVGSLFGKMQGALQNVRIDLSAADADLALFTSDATPTLTKVVIVEDRADWKLGATNITARYVYFETANKTFSDRFAAAPYTSYSVIYNNGKERIAYTFGDTIVATEQEHDTQVFAGWKKDGGISREGSIVLASQAGSAYVLNYINRTLAATEDLVRLAEAVQGGFTYAGVTFTVQSGFEVNESVPTIGSKEKRFEGNIRGETAMSKIVFTGETSVFIYELYGTMENVIFVFEDKVTAEEDMKPALVYLNSGVMSAVVVVAGDAFTDGAALTCNNKGTMSNCWFATSSDDATLAEGSRVGTNRIMIATDGGSLYNEHSLFDIDVQIAVTNVGVKIRFVFPVESESYLALYDEKGKVAFFDNYSYADHSYIAPANTTGVYLEARSLGTVSNEDELKYLRQFLANRHLASGSTITLAADLTVTSAVSMPLGYKVNATPYTFTFDLGYHTLTISSTERGALFTSENDMFGTVQNGTVCLTGTTYALAVAGMNIENVALHLPIAGITIPNYNATDCAIVTPYKDYYKAAYACYYYQAGADVVITVTNEGITAVGADNDSYYYAKDLGAAEINALAEKTLYGLLRDYNDNETEIIYAPAVITSADDFKRFVLANEMSLTKFEGKTFTFDRDVTVDTLARRLTGFKGTLNAGHTLLITSGTYDEAVIAAGEGGSFRRFALAFGKLSVLGETDMITGATEDCVVVSYNDLASASLHAESTVIALNADQNGYVAVSFENGISFTGEDVGNYALYRWKTSLAGEPVNVKDGFAEKTLRLSAFENVKTFIAAFDQRYAFRLNYVDKAGFDTIDDSVLSENAGYLPAFKISGKNSLAQDIDIDFVNGQAICFKTDFEASVKEIELTNIGTGFMFWGLTSAVTAKVDVHTYTLSAPTSGDLSATIEVVVTHIKMDWKKMAYSAGVQTIAKTDVITDIEDALPSGLTPTYSYDNLGDTPLAVDGAGKGVPYHVGKYRVNFKVTDNDSGKVVCNAYAGLEITPIELTFVSVVIADKVYDGTADATLVSVELEGFLNNTDKNAISATGLSFRFVDANAGVNKQVKVSGNGSLCSSASAANDSLLKYAYLDYTFDFDSAVKSANEGLIVATIMKKDLTLKIDSISVEYLDQFGTASKPFLPANTRTEGDAVAAGLIKEDYEEYTNVVSGLLTREDPDRYDVDAYRITVDQSGAFNRLSNYNVTVLGLYDADPYYIVTPSEIEIEFSNDLEIVYGSRAQIGNYVVKHNGEEVDISALHVLNESGEVVKTVSDTLVFENVVFGGGAELIPSDTKYDVRCLFSAKNENYRLKAEAGAEYETLNGDSLRVLTQAEVLKVNVKTINILSDDETNTKQFGKRKETLFASLASGYRFVSSTHRLVVTREAGETVGSYDLIYTVKDISDPSSPVDVTDRYDLHPVISEKSHHTFTIKKVSVLLRIGETTLIYGESIGDKLKYNVVIGDGSLTVRDLYYALNGEEKLGATLADVGLNVTYDQTIVLSVGKNHSVNEVSFRVENNQPDNIEKFTFYEKEGCIEVQKRYLTIVLTSGDSKNDSMTKKYDGTYDLPSQPVFTVGIETKDAKGKVISVRNGLVEKDKALVDVVMTRAYVVGDHNNPRGLTVGSYKVNAEFKIYDKGTTSVSDLADNYEINVQQVAFEVKQADVRIEALLGYFEEDGSFRAAVVNHKLPDGTSIPQEGQIFYGDTRAILCFVIPERYKNSYSFLKVPSGSDKDVSDYLASELRISYNKLCKIPYGSNYDAKSTELSLASANNNYSVTFTADVNIARVNVKVTLLPTTKTVGDADPTIDYVLTAYDDNGGAEIEGYFDYARDAYSITIRADRTEGESLGTYEYSNIVIEVANAYSGETLDETVETDDEQAVLIIEQQSFLKTTVGKILAYGGPVLAVFIGAVLLVLYITVFRKKRKKNKKQSDDELFSDDDEDADAANGESDGATEGGEDAAEEGDGETEAAEGSEASAEEGSEEAPEVSESAEPVADEPVGSEASVEGNAGSAIGETDEEEGISLEISDDPIDNE